MGLQSIIRNPIQQRRNLDSTKKGQGNMETEPGGVEKMISDSVENAEFDVAEDVHNQL